MISNKVTMEVLLKRLSHIKFSEITIKGDNFKAVYTSLNLRVVVEYLLPYAFTTPIKATTYLDNAIVDIYTTVNLNEFVDYMNNVVNSTTVVDAKDQEIAQLKQRIVNLEEFINKSVGTLGHGSSASNTFKPKFNGGFTVTEDPWIRGLHETLRRVNKELGNDKVLGVKPANYGYGIAASDKTWKPYDYTESKFTR